MDYAKRMSDYSGISYIACQIITSASRLVNRIGYDGTKKLSIATEKFVLNAEENEELKERGLTVFDIIEKKFGTRDNEFANNLTANWNSRLGQNIY